MRRINILVHANEDVNNVRVKREERKNQYGPTLGEDLFQTAKDSNVTANNAETTGYLEETQSARAQYDVYEYGKETTNEDTERYTPDRSFISSERSTLADTENPDEEPYDYEQFKMEYEQQLEYDIKYGKALNYTEKEGSEDTPKEALKRIMDMRRPKNCTKEEISQIGIKAIECLAHDYQRARDTATVGKVLSRTWLVLRVWLLIYICLAIPCWCQRGNFVTSVTFFVVMHESPLYERRILYSRMVLLLFPLQVLFPSRENLIREAILYYESTWHAGERFEEREGCGSAYSI